MRSTGAGRQSHSQQTVPRLLGLVFIYIYEAFFFLWASRIMHQTEETLTGELELWGTTAT